MHHNVNVTFYFDFKIIYRKEFRVHRCLLICDPMFIIIALIPPPPTLKNVSNSSSPSDLADFLHITSAVHSTSQLEESK